MLESTLGSGGRGGVKIEEPPIKQVTKQAPGIVGF